MAVRSKTTIMNAALLRTGNSDTAEGDGSGLWRAMEAGYDEVVRSCFEDGDGAFRFGRSRERLTSRTDGRMGYEDTFVMPFEAIHVIEVFFDGVAAADILESWDVDGTINALLLNAHGRVIEVDVIRRGLEHTWSAGFAIAVQRRLEAIIKDVLEEGNEAAAKDQDADYHLLKAQVKGTKNRSARRVWKGNGRLMRARRGWK